MPDDSILGVRGSQAAPPATLQTSIPRTHNAQSVNQTVEPPALPFDGESFVNIATTNEPPPGYSPPTPMSVGEINQRLDQLTVALATKNKGSCTVRPYTTADGLDAILLVYVGLTQSQLTNREIGRPIYLHQTFSKPWLNTLFHNMI